MSQVLFILYLIELNSLHLKQKLAIEQELF